MIYLDNAATTWPKPFTVIDAVRRGMTSLAANPGRGGYAMSMETAQAVYNVRLAADDFFDAPKPESVIFTPSCTQAVNVALTCFLPQGSHVIVSDREHNAVMRPLFELAHKGMLTYDVADVGSDVQNAAVAFERLIKPSTRLLLCIGTSNVTGEQLPLQQLGELAHRRGLLFAVDAAQTAGIRRLSMRSMHIDLLCVAGHKSLYGPMGTGMLLVNGLDPVDALVYGGTGSRSFALAQPDFLPDAEESGTLNVPGILGLGEGLRFVRELGEDAILAHERALASQLYEGLSVIRGVRPLGPPPQSNVVSFTANDIASEHLAELLAREDVCVRAGLHCAPAAHRLLGTLDDGAVRMSLSVYNDRSQLSTVLRAVGRCLQ
ncbi:MAG: aminotransferase class V-fold PLP-dependent enzyme [Clostridia bacterium]|nr:aminotransferase class V-fold PLP-dependent enzyme [Clostridia bacterium]